MSAFGSVTGTGSAGSGTLRNNYRVSSVTGSMNSDDANDTYDGGLTVNLSTGTGSSNYTVVASGKYQVGGSNYSTHINSLPYARTLVLVHAFNRSSTSFKLKGFGFTSWPDYSGSRTHYDEIHFTVFDT